MTSASRITVDDGTALHVEHARLLPRTRACVFIHGYGEGAYVWHETLDAVAGFCATVAIDLRGHGDSARSASGRYDTATHVRDVVHVLGALGVHRPILIGHSLGGDIALRIAAHAPQAVHAAIIVDTCPDPSESARAHVSDSFVQSLRAFASVDDYQRWLLSTRPLLAPAVASRLASRALCERGDGFWIKADPALAHSDESTSEPEDWSDLLREIACPTLIVRGSGSALVSESSAVRMTRLLRRGRLVVIPRAGHAVMSDNEAAFNTVVREFVRTVMVTP